MSTIHQLFSEILKDVENFCLLTLGEEQLSTSAAEARDKLVHKIACVRNAHIQLQAQEVTSEPSSPPPYLDMKGNNNSHTEYVLSDPTEEHYELCQIGSSESITSIPLKKNPLTFDDCKSMPIVSASDMNDALKKGFLDKKSRGIFNQYQKRWCAIKDGILYYFTHSNDNQQCGFIVLSGYEVRNVSIGSKEPKDNKKDLGFELVCPGKRTYLFLAPSKTELEEWMNVIEKVSVLKTEKPFFVGDEIDIPNFCLDDIYECVEDLASKPSFAEEQKDLYDDAKSVQRKGMIKPEEWYLSKWECVADEQNELSFKSGDLIRIVSKEYDNFLWWVGDINGTIGLVPKNFLIEAYEVQ